MTMLGLEIAKMKKQDFYKIHSLEQRSIYGSTEESCNICEQDVNAAWLTLERYRKFGRYSLRPILL